METRKYEHFEALNVLALDGFILMRIEDEDIIFQASNGYPEYYRAEIRFIETQYLACGSFFLSATLRQASLQEFPFAREYPGYHIYCFEEFRKHPKDASYRYYIIAKDVEITVYYAGENVETIFGQSDRIEKDV